MAPNTFEQARSCFLCDASFNDPFKEIMATLRRRILPKTNEDS